MKEKFDLDERLTFKYNDGFSHEDEWQKFGDAQIEASSSDDNDRATFMITCITDEECSMQRIRRALFQNFSRSGCGCEHDCCGCVSAHAQITFLTRIVGVWYFRVDVFYSSNY